MPGPRSADTSQSDSGPETRQTLLLRLGSNSDDATWREFVDIYAPIIFVFASQKGLQASDAEDVTQSVLQRVTQVIAGFHYNPDRGRFRGWLYTLVRNEVVNQQKKNHRGRGAGTSDMIQLLENQPDKDTDPEWEQTYEQQLMQYAMAKSRSDFSVEHWRVFEMTAIEALKPAEVAKLTGVSVGSVYVIKSRIIARLRAVVEQIDGQGFESVQSP